MFPVVCPVPPLPISAAEVEPKIVVVSYMLTFLSLALINVSV